VAEENGKGVLSHMSCRARRTHASGPAVAEGPGRSKRSRAFA
jgi:hypothetical protein